MLHCWLHVRSLCSRANCTWASRASLLSFAFHSGKTYTLLNGLAADVHEPVAQGIIPAFMSELQGAMDSAATSASQISVQVCARQSARFAHASFTYTLVH